MKPFLLEIGTEEIPARFVVRGVDILRNELDRLLTESFIDHGDIHTYATPRRLTLVVDEVVERQKDRVTESLGPPHKIAYDDSGKPTKAAIGFARSLNVDISALTSKETDRGLYLSATVEEKGRPSIEVLSEEIPKLLSTLKLPKSMRWGDGTVRFFRPVHWIVALLGDSIIPFELDGIKSGNITYGHRFLSPEVITLKKPDDYLACLEKAHVIADINTRKKIIADNIAAIESDKGITVVKDEALFETVTNLVEFPVPVLGSFENKYLELPRELPVTVMKTHQKYFSTESREGDLLPYFIVISNTSPENNDTVRKGAEKVLRARLEDARFYYAEDMERPLADYISDLKNVTFQEKLGSLFDKTRRVIQLCSFIADKLGIENKTDLLRAAELAKADLVTGVVSEFPELQGYMGMVYAAGSGENRDVSSAIFEHYKPRFAGDELPAGEIGAVVSVGDKIDNIASLFHLGLLPTGSEDPFALRRQAIGVINIIQEKGYHFSINTLIEKALRPLENSEERLREVMTHIVLFFTQRLEGILLGNGYRHDLINAVLSSDELEIKSLWVRIGILAALKEEPSFQGLLTAAKRVYNIISKTDELALNETMLTEPSERGLLEAARSTAEKITSTDFSPLYDLETPINNFFDEVLVMDKDASVRDNRLALLQKVRAVFALLCDFSKISDE